MIASDRIAHYFDTFAALLHAAPCHAVLDLSIMGDA